LQRWIEEVYIDNRISSLDKNLNVRYDISIRLDRNFSPQQNTVKDSDESVAFHRGLSNSCNQRRVPLPLVSLRDPQTFFESLYSVGYFRNNLGTFGTAPRGFLHRV